MLLLSFLTQKSPLPTRTKLYIYLTFLTYSSLAWTSNISANNLKKLEATQSTILRVIIKLPWYISNKTIQIFTKIPSIFKFSSDTSVLTLKLLIISSHHLHIFKMFTHPSVNSQHIF